MGVSNDDAIEKYVSGSCCADIAREGRSGHQTGRSTLRKYLGASEMSTWRRRKSNIGSVT